MTLAARIAPLFALLAAPFCVPARAADAADYEVASSLVCDTQEQVERFVALFAGDARYPRSPAAKPRKVKDYSGGARKPELRRTAWWWPQSPEGGLGIARHDNREFFAFSGEKQAAGETPAADASKFTHGVSGLEPRLSGFLLLQRTGDFSGRTGDLNRSIRHLQTPNR